MTFESEGNDSFGFFDFAWESWTYTDTELFFRPFSLSIITWLSGVFVVVRRSGSGTLWSDK